MCLKVHCVSVKMHTWSQVICHVRQFFISAGIKGILKELANQEVSNRLRCDYGVKGSHTCSIYRVSWSWMEYLSVAQPNLILKGYPFLVVGKSFMGCMINHQYWRQLQDKSFQANSILPFFHAWISTFYLTMIYSFSIAYPVKRKQLQYVHITLSYTHFIYLFYLSFFTCCKPQLDTVNGQGYFSAQCHCLIYQDNISKQTRLATQIRSSWVN